MQILAEQKILMGRQSYNQLFVPYREPDMPVFITSDCILNAYHLLYEKCLQRLEQIHADQFPAILADMQARLPNTPEAATARRILLVTQGEEAGFIDRVAAGRVMKPEWLGSPDESFMALDFSRFRPRGIYTRTPELQRYFRAVSWLQAIPLRPHMPHEARTFELLRQSVDEHSPMHLWAGRMQSLWGTKTLSVITISFSMQLVFFRPLVGSKEEVKRNLLSSGLMLATGIPTKVSAPLPFKGGVVGGHVAVLAVPRIVGEGAVVFGFAPYVMVAIVLGDVGIVFKIIVGLGPRQALQVGRSALAAQSHGDVLPSARAGRAGGSVAATPRALLGRQALH